MNHRLIITRISVRVTDAANIKRIKLLSGENIIAISVVLLCECFQLWLPPERLQLEQPNRFLSRKLVVAKVAFCYITDF